MKAKKIIIIGCLSSIIIIVILALFILTPYFRAKNRTQLEWARLYSGLSISDSANVLVFERHGGFTSDISNHFILKVSEKEMEDLLFESIEKKFQKLPIKKNEQLRLNIELAEKYRKDEVVGYYYNERIDRCSKVVILDQKENVIIIDDSCF